ncbi:hypothetical protein QJS66_16015 [Kocuria rhizophila]|nr:hypothetical protein QJS66_16015 [Kocuria rhizophila]
MPLHHTTTPAHREPGSPEPVAQERALWLRRAWFLQPSLSPRASPTTPRAALPLPAPGRPAPRDVAGILLAVAAAIAPSGPTRPLRRATSPSVTSRSATSRGT